MTTPTPPFPLLEIVSFVDAYTAVVVGPRSEEIREGDELYVLGVGFSYIPKVNIPLIAPKARVMASFPAGQYVLVKSPAREVQMDIAASLASAVGGRTTYTTRDKLTDAEQTFLGDPGHEPVKIGDVVIRVKDLAAYIKYRVAEQQ